MPLAPFDDHSPNLAKSLVATAPSPATTGTSLIVTTGEGVKFPTPPFRAIIGPDGTELSQSNSEIVDVTAISIDTLTITRNASLATGDPDKQGSARTVVVGDAIRAVITARVIRVIEDVLDWATKTGPIRMLGHSYLSGATQNEIGTPAGRQEAIPSKLQALLGVHESNTLLLGQAGGRIAGNGIERDAAKVFAGWTGMYQFDWPNNSAVINAATDVVITDPIVSVGGPLFIVHGCNDFLDGLLNVTADDDQRAINNRNAAKHAYRAIISRGRAGVVFANTIVAGTLTPDATVTFQGTWGNVAAVTVNSGGGLKSSTDFATPASFTITIPTNFTGGTVAISIIGNGNGVTHLTAGYAASGAISPAVAASGEFPASGTLLIKNVTTGEEMLVTAGLGTTTWTVTSGNRGRNGTSAAAGSTNDVIMWAADHGKIVWSGTVFSAGSNPSHPDVFFSGQGSNNFGIAIVTRYALTGADAGKTIIGTLGGLITGDTSLTCYFDSWWIEAPYPPAVIVTNVHDWEYGHKTFSTNARIVAFNDMIDDVVAEFDEYVRVADVYTRFWKRNGKLTSDVNSSATSIGFTSNDPSFDVNEMVGALMTFGKQSGEQFRVTAVSGSHPSWTLTIVRAQNGTSAVDPAANDWIGPMTWMYKDQIHLNVLGHAVYAEALHAELCKMPRPSEYQVAQSGGNWAQYTRDWGPGLIDNAVLMTQASVMTTATMTQARQWAVPIWVGRHCIVTGIGIAVTADAGATIRYGIYMPDATNARPGKLLQELGTISGASIDASDGAAELTGCYQVLRPGWYWLSAVSQGANATCRMTASGGGGGSFPILPDTNATLALTTSVAGWFKSGVAGALADWSSGTPGTGNTPRMYIRVRVLTQ